MHCKENVKACHMQLELQCWRNIGSIHLSAEISFRAESFGSVPEFLAESFGSKCHFGMQMYGPYVTFDNNNT